MPIRPDERHRYPNDWPAISALARFKAGNRCQDCGLRNGALGGRLPDGSWREALPTGDNGIVNLWPEEGSIAPCCGGRSLKIIRVVLTVGHKDHCPENNAPKNRRVWCQQCHLRYDAKNKAAGRKLRARAQRAARDLFDADPPSAMIVGIRAAAKLLDGPTRVFHTDRGTYVAPLDMKALFIPLKREWFAAFESGDKTTEWRAYGKRWNERTCPIGRLATVSLGYSGKRLRFVVAGFRKTRRSSAPLAALSIYPRAKWFAGIELVGRRGHR